MSGTTDPDYTQVAEMVGLTSLRSLYPSLTGAGVTVGQVEGSNSGTANDFEVDPGQIGHPADNSDGFLTYHNGLPSTTTYNDGVVGTYSAHATTQASFFYGDALFDGEPTGVSPGVAHVDNYFADTFTINLALPLPDKVVNMSFLYDPPTNDDTDYDIAANRDNVVFVASAGNGGTPGSPSSAYNVISVDSSIAPEAVGPAADGVRKPDISAPQMQTSRTAAIVSGCAALLVQAGEDGWSGATTWNEQDAVDFRTIKALLLNGASKPADYYANAYAPTASQPLSAIYGSGQVNIFNSVQELYGGEVAPGASNSVTAGGPLATPLSLRPVATTQGWDLGNLAASGGDDSIDSYEYSLSAGQGVIATITWAADNNNAIDSLELDLVNNSTVAVLASSDAADSNVQQVRYTAASSTNVVIEVRLLGGQSGARTDTYALAFAPLASVACFTAGARILTDRGEVPVQRLIAGDRVVTASGRLAPVRFVGHMIIGVGRAVRMRANAFADGVPHRDLSLSPDHAIGIGGALMPVGHLANGATVAHGPVGVLDYYHLELDRHELVFAEGLTVESYLDTGNRSAFTDAQAGSMRYGYQLALSGGAG